MLTRERHRVQLTPSRALGRPSDEGVSQSKSSSQRSEGTNETLPWLGYWTRSLDSEWLHTLVRQCGLEHLAKYQGFPVASRIQKAGSDTRADVPAVCVEHLTQGFPCTRPV
jgi:hypothetical protein